MYNKIQSLIWITLIVMSTANAQVTVRNEWQKLTTRSSVITLDDNRKVEHYSIYDFNSHSISDVLKAIPHQNDIYNTTDVIVEFPTSEDDFIPLKLFRSETLSDGLSEKFPEIQTFYGVGADDPSIIAAIELTPKGLTGYVLNGNHESVVIQPYENHYLVYDRKRVPKNGWTGTCLTNDEEHIVRKIEANPIVTERAGDCKYREFKVAIAATGEYTAYHGGTVSAAMSAIAVTLNRVNLVLRKEVAVNLKLITNNNLIVYTNSSTDPYTNGDLFTMLSQNQTNVDAVIGASNYDIGHVFGTGYGGLAYIGVTCYPGYKAQGTSTHPVPIGDGFDLDICTHEFGHMLGAFHSHYAQSGSCDGSIVESSCYEVGSGSTIMAYPGICDTPDNVEWGCDEYFHAISLQEIGNNLASSGCGTIITTLTKPTANAGADYSINKKTPFKLTGTATNGGEGSNSLTYVWEQMNKEIISIDGSGNITTYPSPPQETNAGGPMFRSIIPANTLSREMPSTGVLNGTISDAFEKLPNISRTLNFRFTVRSIDALGRGCTAEDNMVLSLTNASPLTVNSPGAVNGGQSYTITWNVNGSNSSPVNATNVELLFSSNNGISYTSLIGNTLNDGFESVIIPNIGTLNARIMVRATNHPLFNISPKFTVIYNSNLSVDYVSLTATPHQENIELEWLTKNESNNKGFQIEKSTAPDKDFRPIGWVTASNQNHYSFLDNNLIKNIDYYYRLIQIDNDGKEHISPIVNAKILRNANSNNEDYKLKIVPNPSSGQNEVEIYIPEFQEGPVTVELYSLDGVLLNIYKTHLSHTLSFKYKVDDLPNGIYLIKTTIDKLTMSNKLMIMN